VLLWFEPEPRDEPIEFIGSEPTVLSDIFSERLAANGRQHLFREVTVVAV